MCQTVGIGGGYWWILVFFVSDFCGFWGFLPTNSHFTIHVIYFWNQGDQVSWLMMVWSQLGGIGGGLLVALTNWFTFHPTGCIFLESGWLGDLVGFGGGYWCFFLKYFSGFSSFLRFLTKHFHLNLDLDLMSWLMLRVCVNKITTTTMKTTMSDNEINPA